VTLALIDYGAGNLQSVYNALKAAGATDVVVTADPKIVAKADRIVLPGVGAFGHCVNALNGIYGLHQALNDAVCFRAVPFLGICVGMQLMAEEGEERFGTEEDEVGVYLGLSWIDAVVRRIQPKDESIKIPHMGWNDVVPVGSHPLIEAGEAYFLHSYSVEVEPDDQETVLATTYHGATLTAAIGFQNRIGVQFHPEKSQAYGINFLQRFLEWMP
jgi:imidazole glycerol-phosphate synthase subunit HisH